MIHTEKQALKLAKKVIEKFYTDYNVKEGISISFRKKDDLLYDYGEKDVWLAAFLYGASDYGTDVHGFLTILDETLEPIYFHVRGGSGKFLEGDLDGIWPIED